MAKTRWRQGKPLPDNLQEKLRALIQSQGDRGAAKLLGIAVISVTRAALGCGTREGTRLLIQTRLEELATRNAA